MPVKLLPMPEQATALLATLEVANVVANSISRLAWEVQEFGQYALHKRAYHAVRADGVLSAQMVVRVISKVADAYKLDRQTIRTFHAHGSVAFDDRILRWFPDAVSIWTTSGRQRIPFVCGKRQRPLLAFQQGESDLVYRDGQWYLFATVNMPEPESLEPVDVLGVDLGIVNIAVDSDGVIHAGAHLNGLRHRHRRLRKKLQAKGTKGARRLLRKRSRKEGRHATHVNHVISKRLVASAQGTTRAIALEKLKGIRSRVTARKPRRATLHSWSFDQLGQFVIYKSRMAGVPLLFVDPRNSSRTCPCCGSVSKANRRTQSLFLCQSCGFSGLADCIAATVLRDRGRALVNAPHCSEGDVIRVEPPGQSPLL